MVRHTLKSLGPKVLATRQVRDYVRELYAPAAHNTRELNSDYAGARELAAWKHRVRGAWDGVRVEHVESHGHGDSPEVGSTLTVRAFVALGSLSADDVEVQVVSGRTTAEDEITASAVTPMTVAESYEDNRHRFDAQVPLDRSGSFGYTVRVVPRHAGLASVAELGLVSLPG
jgi:starch phosphorylase